jgi:hypothetical protein
MVSIPREIVTEPGAEGKLKACWYCLPYPSYPVPLPARREKRGLCC